MKLSAYSIYDNKVASYHPPFFQATDGAAVRMFHDLVNDQATNVARHPADFSLWYVGVFDDSSAKIYGEEPRRVIDALSLVKEQNELFRTTSNGKEARNG